MASTGDLIETLGMFVEIIIVFFVLSLLWGVYTACTGGVFWFL